VDRRRQLTTVESKLNSVVSEIRGDVKSENELTMEKINILTSKNDQIMNDMNNLKDLIKQLLEKKQGVGSTTGNNSTLISADSDRSGNGC
jgi:hypothetical protein